MKSLITLGIAFIVLAACTPKEPSQENGSGRFITVNGQDLVKPDGEKFFIRGINLGNWINPEGYMFRLGETSSYRLINQMFCELTGEEFTADFWNQFKENYITEADIHYIAATGMNTLRIPFHYKLFTDEYYMGRNDSTEGFRLIDRVVDWCRKEDLRVILDMHDAPGGQTGDNIDDSYGYPWLLESEMQQQRCCNIWQRIAEHYANDTIVIGYDLLNEPIAPYEAERLEALNAALEPLYMRITKAIREVDQNHIVMLGGAQWNGNFSVFKDSKFDDKMMYTCHRYWCDTIPLHIADFVHFRDSVNLPMYMGETGENTDEWIHGFTAVMESQNIGWTYWPYKKMDATSCMKRFKMSENWELIRAYAAADRGSFKKIRDNKVAQDIAKAVMNELLENVKFENCLTNEGYIRAMGMKP
jgi:aryl-phospho-beta-D-glucosidase BglC (GH1 family)